MRSKFIITIVAAAVAAVLWDQPYTQYAPSYQEKTSITFFSRKSDELSKKVKELERQMKVLKNDRRPVGSDHIQRLWQELLGLWEKGALSRAKAMELYQLLADVYWMSNPKQVTTHTNQQPTVQQKDQHEVSSGSTNLQSEVKATQQEIDQIGNNPKGYISETHYNALKKKLDYFTSQGITGLERYYQIIGERSPSAVAAADKKQEAELAERKKRQENPYYDCPADRPPPELAADFTDARVIKMITPPGTLTGDRDVAKGHFWIWTEGARVPLYVPIDAVFESMSSGPASAQDKTIHHTLNFKVKNTCGYTFRFGHITDPDFSLKEGAILPAGSLVGYTIGNIPSGNWDIGFYDRVKEGELAKIDAFGLHRYGVCLVDYYSSEKRNFYRALLDPNGPRRVCQY